MYVSCVVACMQFLTFLHFALLCVSLRSDVSVKDMEAAAVGWAVQYTSTPLVVVKVVTDIVDGGKPTEQELSSNLAAAATSLQTNLLKMMEFLKNKSVLDLWWIYISMVKCLVFGFHPYQLQLPRLRRCADRIIAGKFRAFRELNRGCFSCTGCLRASQWWPVPGPN